MTATITPSANRKDASPSKSIAIDRIHHDLDEMVSRLSREIWIGGTLVAVTFAIVSLLVILVIDAIFQPESAWSRALFWLPLFGVVGAVTQRFLVKPLKQECGRLAMAWTLEQKQPKIEERLTTSLQLTETPNGKTSELVEAVAQQAYGSLAGCREEDLRGQEVLRRTIIAGASLAAFVLSMWIWAPYLIPSLQNILNPWNTRVLPYLNATILPGNTVVGEGDDVRVIATAGRLKHAVLEVIENDAVITSHQMDNGTNGTTAEFTLTEMESDLEYRIRDGGLYSDRYQIDVDPKPVIKNTRVILTFPEYTQLPPQVIDDPTELIEVIHGTLIQIDVDVDSTLPAADSSLSFDETSSPCKEVVGVEETGLWRYSWEFTVTESELQVGTITLVSEAGVQSDPFTLEVRTLPDLPPTIFIEQPALSEVTAMTDLSIVLAFHALDDFGYGALQLISQKNSEAPSIKDVPHDPEAGMVGELIVNLNEFEVASGDQLTVWMSTADNRPAEFGGPQVTDSRKIRIQIADEAIPINQQIVQNEEHALLINVTKAIEDLQQAAEFANELQAELDEITEVSKTPAEVLENSKQLQDQITQADKALRQLTAQDESTQQSLFQPELEQIQEVTDNEVAEAKNQAGLIPLSDDRPQQQEAITATKESLNDAIEKLKKVRDGIDERGKQLELAAQLDELARQQDRLAQELNKGQDNAQDTQKKQQQVADTLQEVIEQDLNAKSEQFAQRAEKAAELTETAAELQKQQEELAKLDQVRSKDELDDQLLDMIAREQEQIAKKARRLEEQGGDVQPPVADSRQPAQPKSDDAAGTDQNRKPDAVAEAREQMEAVPEKLRQKQLEQAEVGARQAGEKLQEKTKSMPQDGAKQPDAKNQDKASPQENDLRRLAKQQERVSDAIKAVREDRPEEAVAKLQEQIADRTERLRESADELLQLPTEDSENQQAVQEAREKLAQAEKETKAAEERATPQPNQAGEQQKQAGDPKQANEQKKQAAKSLEEAAQSLDAVCKSCQKCSKCNNPSASGGSSGSKPKTGGNQSASKNGDQSQKSQPGPKSGESGQSSPRGQQPNSKKLAGTADKAHQAAQTPSPKKSQELAQELNQLADAAAQQAGFPKRNSKSQNEQSNPSKSSNSSQQAGAPQPGNPSEPQGVKGNSGANQSEVAPTQLRGRSTSNWTQSRRKLKSNVLDDQDSKIPEEFRGVVKDYFEELSRLESRRDKAEDQN